MKSKEQKNLEAKQRQKVYDALSDEEKIQLAESRRGNSAKEIKRIKK